MTVDSVNHARDAAAAPGHKAEGGRWKIALAALGVVYGDIGTSPLYTLKECFHGDHAIAPSAPNLLGVLSLVFWALTSVVTVKYLAFILQADNHGEGGILALLALVPQDKTRRRTSWLVLLVVFGAALLYGDGVITPAISVLSAMEGLEVATPALKPAVVPLTVAILIGLFVVQKRGTGGIGRVFGPVMLVWFTLIGALGLVQIARAPGVLEALDPAPRGVVLPGEPGQGLPHPRLRGAGHHRRRGALRRHGPLRQGPHPAHLARARLPGARPELLRAGGAPPRPPGVGGQPVLRHRAPAAALSRGRRRHLGCGGGLAGARLRRLLAHPAGGAARLLPARDHRAHLGADRGPDLHPRDQQLPPRSVRQPGARFQELQIDGRVLRHRGDGHDEHHHHRLLRGHAEDVGLAHLEVGAAGRRVPAGRPWRSSPPPRSSSPTAAGSRC